VERLSADQRMESYRRVSFAELEIVPLAQHIRRVAPWVPPALAVQIVALSGGHAPSIYVSRSGVNSALSAHLADPLIAWPELLRQDRDVHVVAFALLAGFALIAYLIAASYRRERRHHRAARRLAAQLQASNALLSAEARDDALTGALSRRYFLSLVQQAI